MNIATYIVIALVVLAVVLAVRSLVKSHASGGHCANCGSAGSCAGCKISVDKMVTDMNKASTAARKK